MVPVMQPSHLVNPLATSANLAISASRAAGVPADLEASIRFTAARLVQAAGILLRLPQELIAQSIVVVYRFWAGPDGSSLVEFDSKDVAAAVLYVVAKPSPTPLTARQVLTVVEHLHSIHGDYAAVVEGKTTLDDLSAHLSEGKYEAGRAQLYQIESHILRVLGFHTHVALPYTLCINYMQALDVFTAPSGPTVAKRAVAHLNTALLSPQLLHLTHQPPTMATAAIYLAAREVGAKLPETEWWEVFDVDREELGFVVVALLSVEGFASEERRRWSRRDVPMTVPDLKLELERRETVEAAE